MCGLWGCKFADPDPRLGIYLAAVGIFMDQRGGHSWGFADGNGITKGLGHFSTSVRTDTFHGTFFLGHCRYATVGAVTKENAHPFEQGDIVGAHNGGVANWRELNEKYGRNFQVDSQHIFETLARDLPVDEVAASGAITWYDKNEPDSIRFLRTISGTFHLGQVFADDDPKKPIGVVWGSTEQSIRSGLTLAGFSNYKIFEPIFEDIYEATGDGVVYRTSEDIKFASRWDWERAQEKAAKEKESKKGKKQKEDHKQGMTYGHRRYEAGTYVSGRFVPFENGTGTSKSARDAAAALVEAANRQVAEEDEVDLEQERDQWEADPNCFNGRCFGCDTVQIPVKQGGELGVPLCFDCENMYCEPQDALPDDDDASEAAMKAALERTVAKDDMKDQQRLIPLPATNIVSDADGIGW